MAFPADLSDVATNDIITASRNNAITNKIGANGSDVITSIDYLLKNTASTDPGHLHTKVGTIATGVWNGTTIAVANGGTGATSLTDGGVLLGSGTGAITATSVLGDGEILIGDASGDPATLDVGSSTAITILGTVATGVWNGTAIANGYLANSSVNYGGITVALGGSDTTPAFDLTDAEKYPGTSDLVTVGTIGTGTWNGTAIADSYVANDLTISGGTINNSVIGGSTAAAGTFTGIDIEAEGDLHLQDSSGGEYVGWDAPATVDSSYTMTLPAAIGDVGDVLKINNIDGTLEWGTAGGGGAGPDFTTAVTITTDTDPAFKIDQTGSGDEAIVLFESDDPASGNERFKMVADGRTTIQADAFSGETGWSLDVATNEQSPILFNVLANGSTALRIYESSEWRTQVTGRFGVSSLSFFSGTMELSALFYLTGTSPVIQLEDTNPRTCFFQGHDNTHTGWTFKGGREHASNDEVFMSLVSTADKDDGNYTAIESNVITGSTHGFGGTTNLLLDLQVDGNTVFNIDTDGIFAINSDTDALTINQAGAGNALAIQDDGTEVLRFDQDLGDLVWHDAGSECITFSQSGAGAYMIIKRAAANLITLSPCVQFHGGITVPQGIVDTAQLIGSQLNCNAGMRLRGTGDNGWGDNVLFDQDYELTEVGQTTYKDTDMTIPANSILLAVTGRLNVAPTGTSTVDVGVDGDPTRFGTVTSSDYTQFEFSGLFGMYTSATKIRFTPDVQPNTDQGRIRVSITWIELNAPTA